MQDALKFIEAMGGGLSAAVIFGLAYFAHLQNRQLSEIQNKRVEDQSLFWERLNAVLKTVETWVSSIKEILATVVTEIRELRTEKAELTREVRALQEEVRKVLHALDGKGGR